MMNTIVGVTYLEVAVRGTAALQALPDVVRFVACRVGMHHGLALQSMVGCKNRGNARDAHVLGRFQIVPAVDKEVVTLQVGVQPLSVYACTSPFFLNHFLPQLHSLVCSSTIGFAKSLLLSHQAVFVPLHNHQLQQPCNLQQLWQPRTNLENEMEKRLVKHRSQQA